MTRKENDHGKDIRKNEGHSKTQEEKKRAQPATRHHRELPGITEGEVRHRGMTKQDYYRQSCMFQKILVRGNIRTFAAIRREVLELSEKIDMNPDLTALDPADAERLKTILEILNYLY